MTTQEQLAALERQNAEVAGKLAEAFTGGDMDAYKSLLPEAMRIASALKEAQGKVYEAEIAEAKSQLGHVIRQTVESLELAKMLGEGVRSVSWELVEEKDDDGNLTGNYLTVIGVNRKSPTRKPSSKSSTSSAGTGERRNLKAIFEEKATTDDRAYLSELDAKRDAAPKGSEERRRVQSASWAAKNRVSQGEAARPS